MTKDNDAQNIYTDLEKEIREAVAALDETKDLMTYDVFFGPNGGNKTTTVAAQVAKWKKVGNSLLLRMALRYSKLNPAKGAALATEALLNGGVMASNSDNV